MRISDWSSDVCSSDLGLTPHAGAAGETGMNLSRKIIVVGLLASVAACAPKPPPPPPPPPPEPVVIIVPPRPIPQNQAAATQILPMRGLDGHFATLNSQDRKSTRLNSSH